MATIPILFRNGRSNRMRLSHVLFIAGIAMLAPLGFSDQASNDQPYKVTKSVKVGGPGGFDYVFADTQGRRLYIPRSGGADSRVTVYDLDTLAATGVVPNT